ASRSPSPDAAPLRSQPWSSPPFIPYSSRKAHWHTLTCSPPPRRYGLWHFFLTTDSGLPFSASRSPRSPRKPPSLRLSRLPHGRRGSPFAGAPLSPLGLHSCSPCPSFPSPSGTSTTGIAPASSSETSSTSVTTQPQLSRRCASRSPSCTAPFSSPYTWTFSCRCCWP